MESGTSENRPDSPKKKLKPSSTTSDSIESHSRISVDSAQHSGSFCTSNGIAPTRRHNYFEASSSSETATPITSSEQEQTPSSIQEEVVSSSESSVTSGQRKQVYNEGDADSLTNDADSVISNDVEEAE